MKLLVRVIEAKNIVALDPSGFSDPYVKLKLGRQKFKSKVVKKCLNPYWCEDFTFKVDDLKKKLKISVLDEKYFNDDCIGRIEVPISHVFEAKDQSLGTIWYKLHPRNRKAKIKDCGEILLSISFSQNNSILESSSSMLSKQYSDNSQDSVGRPEEATTSREEKISQPTLAGRIANIFNRNAEITSVSSDEGSDGSKGGSETSLDQDQQSGEQSLVDFEEIIRCLETREQETEVDTPLSGGVVLDCLYGISPREFNSLLFSPNSEFFKSYLDKLGTSELQMGLWKLDNGCNSLKRVISYTKPPSKLIRSLKATEEQSYLKAKDGTYAILASVSTPDAPCGKTFKAEVLYLITPGPDQPSGELSSRFVISWRINFSQSTMMRSMIENGARQGIKESFEQYGKMLSQTVRPLDLKDSPSDKNQLPPIVESENQSVWGLVAHYFVNVNVVVALLTWFYVITHIWLAAPTASQGLEFVGLDLPDSISELIVCLVLLLQGKRVLEIISCFFRATQQKGCDHGVKAQGAGWLLTVVLIEGSDLITGDSNGPTNHYAVFTCNGKSRTSSVKFQKSEPVWNEIFEFDAEDEPPSTLDIEVFGRDGQSDEAKTFGRAEINFLRSNISDLSDIWIPLQGQLAQTCQSKLRLRIFLDNTRGSCVVKDYLAKMEKEVGKKLKLRSPQTNSAFQKLFGLPPEEFLINDFSCHLKRKMPLQGRLFLSTRMVGFHADLFGHKTKFFFLWEDIEGIQVTPPTLSSMGSPIIVITLRPGRGFDARHGARKLDSEGRLNFLFHSFVSFNVAQRTILALWKARVTTLEPKAQIVDDESDANVNNAEDESCGDEADAKSQQAQETDETTTFLGSEDNIAMSSIHSSTLSLPAAFFMELFNSGETEQRIMERTGCLNYTFSSWQSERQDIHQRQVHYTFDKLVYNYKEEVKSIQQKSLLPRPSTGWFIEEVMSLPRVQLSDYFTVHLHYRVEDLATNSTCCSIRIYLGIAWLKNTRNQKKIAKSIKTNMKKRIKIMLDVLDKEYALRAESYEAKR